MIEIFKVKTGIAPEFMRSAFEFADVPGIISGISVNVTVAYDVLKKV